MSYEFEKMLKERWIIKGKITQEMIAKELKSAEYDLNKARLSYNEGDFKWAIVQAYYAMFHEIRALVYRKGYREKSHYALKIAFRELFVDAGVLERKYYKYFEDAMDLRESADYLSEYSEGGAKEAVENAGELLGKIKSVFER